MPLTLSIYASLTLFKNLSRPHFTSFPPLSSTSLLHPLLSPTQCTAKLARDVLGAVVEGHLGVESFAAQCVVKDALLVLAGPHIKLTILRKANHGGAGAQGGNDEDAGSAAQMRGQFAWNFFHQAK